MSRQLCSTSQPGTAKARGAGRSWWDGHQSVCCRASSRHSSWTSPTQTAVTGHGVISCSRWPTAHGFGITRRRSRSGPPSTCPALPCKFATIVRRGYLSWRESSSRREGGAVIDRPCTSAGQRCLNRSACEFVRGMKRNVQCLHLRTAGARTPPARASAAGGGPFFVCAHALLLVCIGIYTL